MNALKSLEGVGNGDRVERDSDSLDRTRGNISVRASRSNFFFDPLFPLQV